MPTPSFQISEEKLEQLDDIIWEKKGAGELPRDASRSDILRQLVEEYIEGNGNTSKTVPKAIAE